MTFGQQLQYLRKQKGYSQEQLAQQLYVTLNRYTVIGISTTKEYVSEAETVLSDYQLHLPY